VYYLTAQPQQAPRTIERAKQQVRDRIWALLEHERAAKPPGRVIGKIPNFLGAEAAADQLAALPAWEAARVLKANPDKAQRPVRARALTEGKVLYMAVPRLADELPFYLLDPEHLRISPWEAAAKEGAATAGQKVAATDVPSVDLVVCGSVAVNRQGARIGKGGGFSDLEVAFLVEAGVIRPDTVLATTVHPLQVLDEPSPKPSTTSGWTSSSPRTRPSGALNRTGHQASSGSTWTKTRSPKSQCWRPWQHGAKTPRQPAAWSPSRYTFLFSPQGWPAEALASLARSGGRWV
jgi:5-formyltetrahydrofolate cyclo-ligase